MGKFINTTRKETINNLVEGFKQRIQNPYYMHIDKKPTIVDYFSTNIEGSTLDDGLKIAQEQIGEQSPFKYNLIKDFYLYSGFNQIPLQLENSEFGLTADNITDTSIVLPNTIVPVPGDMFKLLYLNKSYLFEVISVNTDSFESGSNFYKIEYEYSRKNDSEIMPLVKDTYVMILDNINTKFVPIIKKEEYDYIEILDEICVKLKQYYRYLYYSDRVETFIFNNNGDRFYDPFLIEFLIRNDILEGDDEKFIYIKQQMSLPNTFNIDYDNTFFRSLETKSIDKLSDNRYVTGKYINQPLSLLSMRKENYFSLNHVKENDISVNKKYEVFTENLYNRIINSDIYNDNKLVDKFNKFRSTLTIIENSNVNEIVESFKGLLKVLSVEDIEMYNGLVTILKKEDIGNYKGIFTNTYNDLNEIVSEDDNIKLFDSLLKISNVKAPDLTFSGMLNIEKGTRVNIYKGIVKCLDEIALKENTRIFKASITVNNISIDNRNKMDNLIIKYFNNINISIDDINNLEDIQYCHDNILFYYVPIMIFILEYHIKSKLIKSN